MIQTNIDRDCFIKLYTY